MCTRSKSHFPFSLPFHPPPSRPKRDQISLAAAAAAVAAAAAAAAAALVCKEEEERRRRAEKIVLTALRSRAEWERGGEKREMLSQAKVIWETRFFFPCWLSK